MKILVNTDSSVKGDERLVEVMQGIVEDALRHFSEEITRVEVHLQDENGPKQGADDKRCTMEARVKGMQPTAVTHHAAKLDDAAMGAAERLRSALDTKLGKRSEQR
ncbi:HPF/RaiA family ribosome-associated protein [Bradymonas sediminis]|uniref:HPF/RaiA family ribosome-associated protein n=1 Tax=Bradymonas sediminis TaxID=1548548 RepID=A0A2Z4FNX0_9DELT|nr:HPF/RaiA family ribosome-associated protein [Bradymonas sediminis]AWV90425.1 HPF/RaiA family ribosome-associated protein [Bradymonas sediminis]TDP72189.1 hypothetical protein DFR33_107171 [Bradymonas sediminis]